MPSLTAKRKCPDLIFIKPRFDAYKAVSLQIRQIFAEYTPIIEPLSLDEAYLDVTENLKGIVSATWIAEEIRARIRAETHLTASVGVSYNKFLAKLASDHKKPDGLFVITPEMGPAFVETLPVRASVSCHERYSVPRYLTVVARRRRIRASARGQPVSVRPTLFTDLKDRIGSVEDRDGVSALLLARNSGPR
jgi:impB/mucB/samB family